MPKWVPRKSDWGQSFFCGLLFVVLSFSGSSYLHLRSTFSPPSTIGGITGFFFVFVSMAFNFRLVHRVKMGGAERPSKRKRFYKALILLVVTGLFGWAFSAQPVSAYRCLIAILFFVVMIAAVSWNYVHLIKRLPKE